jgi:2'-5' RNA ligase
MAETIRAFIAVELTTELKELLGQVAQQLESRFPPRAVRWVKPAAMHLTLVFLGNTPVDQLKAVEGAMTTSAHEIPSIEFSAVGLACNPNPRKPRVVWVGVDEPADYLKRLKKALDRELEPLGFKAEKRAYSPHITLGRINKRASRDQARQVGQVVEGATLHQVGRMVVSHIHLIRSDLKPTGPVYTTLASIPLEG